MEELFKGFIALVFVFFVIFLVAIFGGILTWLIWPHIIPVVFPGLVAKGYIVSKLSLWNAILINWLFGVLFKSSNSNSITKSK